MGRKLTNDEYIEKLHKINPNIHPLEKYNYAINKIWHRCDVCGNEWQVCPRDTLSGRGCPVCADKRKKKFQSLSHKEYLQRVLSIHNTIEVVDEYKDNKTPIKHKCLKCGYVWNTKPQSILQGCKCPKCAGNYSYTQEEYIQKVAKVNPNIEVLGSYQGSHTKIKHKCLIDGCIWSITPSDVLSGKGCPHCKKSKGEEVILNYLNTNNILYSTQHKFDDCKNIFPLPFDFYLPNYNMCIEYDGEQHYRPIEYFGGQEKFIITQQNDNIKTRYCQNNNIKLLRIPYWEFNNINKILANTLGLYLQIA